ncbi:MAG: tetratricopeptide repeat protein [Planctomycetes bacterium]|nr:tetratricopeptide repeat protein [Planctomycetota bacterium]
MLVPAVLLACHALVAGPQTQAPDLNQAVDDEARCADCHDEIVASYAKTGMARALRPIEDVDLSGLERVLEAPSRFHYHFEGAGADARIVEQWLGRDGQPRPETRTEVPLRFAIGAGIFDTAFAAEHGDAWWFAPLELISAHGGASRHAQLSPKHMQRAGQRFTSPVPDDCLACHTERLPSRGYPQNSVPTEPWTPRGIGCAGCHLHGPEHAEWRDAELGGRTPDSPDPLLAPSRMTLEQRVSLCARCHMQGDARVVLEPGLVGLPPPGCDLLAVNAVFIGAGESDEIGFVSAGERMLESKCFEASMRSSKPMTCETCHDPHRTLFEPSETARVRNACMRCHVESGTPPVGRSPACSLEFELRGEKDCVDCHMRKTPPFDVFGVEIHDHSIRVVNPPPSSYERVRATQANGGPLARVAWPGKPVPLADDPGVRLLALRSIGQNQGAARLLDAKCDPTIANTVAYQFTRAGMLASAGRAEEARACYERARALDPTEPAVQTNLAGVLNQLGRHGEALKLLDPLLERVPHAEAALLNRARARAALGELAGARTDLETLQASRPRGDVAESLANLCEALGDGAAAARWRAAARRIEPRE